MAPQKRGSRRGGAHSRNSHRPAGDHPQHASNPYNPHLGNLPSGGPGFGAGLAAHNYQTSACHYQAQADEMVDQNGQPRGEHHQQQQQQQQQHRPKSGAPSRAKSKRSKAPPPRLALNGEQLKPEDDMMAEVQTPDPDGRSPGADSRMDARSPMDMRSPSDPPSPGDDPHRKSHLPRSPTRGPNNHSPMTRGSNYQPQKVPSKLRPPPAAAYAQPPRQENHQPPPPPAYSSALLSPPPYSNHYQNQPRNAHPHQNGQSMGKMAPPQPSSPRGEKSPRRESMPGNPKTAPPPPAPEAEPRSGGGGGGGGGSSSPRGKKAAFVVLGIIVVVLVVVGIYFLVKHTSGGSSGGGGGGGGGSSGGKVNSSSSEDAPLPGSGEKFTGDITYYSTGLGSCGQTSTDNDPICAISHITYDAAQQGGNPNSNPLCGKKIRIERNGRTADVTVVDRCEACQATDLDLSPALFGELADMSQGRVQATWAWL